MTAARPAAPAEIGSPEAPALSRDPIRRELEQLHQRQHRTLRSAIYARLAEPSDDGATVSAKVNGEEQRFRVVATSGELDLRRKLAREREGDDPVAYIVPFSRQLPRDLEAMIAGGRLWWPQIEWLLPRRFGARSGTPRLTSSKLRGVAQREGTRVYGRGDAPSIDLDDAWLVFLRDRLGLEGLETEAQLFAATLLDRDRRGNALGALLAAVKGAREEVTDVLGRRMGPSAPLILAAWLEDAAVELAAMAIVGEATRAVLNEAKGPSFTLLTTVLEMRVLQTQGHPLRSVLGKERISGLSRVLVDLGYLVPLVWQRLAGDGHDPLRRAILGEAESILGAEQVRPLALGSNRLPFVFEHRCKAFVEAVAACAGAADVASARRAIEAVDDAAAQLLAHDAAHGDERLEEQVEMAARLAAFLGEPEPQSAASPHAEVIGLATFQATVGRYVDWARQIVRSDGAGPFGKGLAPLVQRVDQVRDALDARFARAYAQLVGKKGDRGVLRGAALLDGRSAELLLIEDVLARVGLSLLEQQEDLRLLVLCMDGMSAANLTELWRSVARTSFVPVSRGRRLPVLAHVPTLTKLSRSALFAGRAMTMGESLDTGRDGDRLAHHPAVVRMGESPSVLLRSDILGAGGGLSDDASQIVRGDQRIVAVVVNAIDDQLKGSAQLRVALSTATIRPLRALLDAAESTGRLVLLVSDHGNISSQRFVGAAVRSAGRAGEESESGARYRTLGPSESAMPDEIELPAGALVTPAGVDRVAVAVHETVRYTSVLHAGEHGGASLSEAVAPAVLLAPRGLLPELAALDVVEAPLEPPPFWSRERAPSASADLDEREASAAPQPPAPAMAPLPRPAPPAPPPRSAPPAQALLPFGPPAEPQGVAAGPGPESTARPELSEALFKSQLFRQQIRETEEAYRDDVKRAIALLLRHGGRMTRDRFAVELKIDTAGKGVRVPGFLTRLERVLNVDQELVISMDRKGQNILLDEHLLRAIFLEEGDG
ncbi:BREX-2 system phosphatase PglZ [Sorangium sp. So ce327]|uniref:BREX-2 system phosphatase PglZ n=1 Tax=Sorangium sp. So ce327 TaxID=3133301 RepID=UPI003F601219